MIYWFINNVLQNIHVLYFRSVCIFTKKVHYSYVCYTYFFMLRIVILIFLMLSLIPHDAWRSLSFVISKYVLIILLLYSNEIIWFENTKQLLGEMVIDVLRSVFRVGISKKWERLSLLLQDYVMERSWYTVGFYETKLLGILFWGRPKMIFYCDCKIRCDAWA